MFEVSWLNNVWTSFWLCFVRLPGSDHLVFVLFSCLFERNILWSRHGLVFHLPNVFLSFFPFLFCFLSTSLSICTLLAFTVHFLYFSCTFSSTLSLSRMLRITCRFLWTFLPPDLPSTPLCPDSHPFLSFPVLLHHVLTIFLFVSCLFSLIPWLPVMMRKDALGYFVLFLFSIFSWQ